MNSFSNIPEDFIQKWQEIADLLAKIINIPAALIMKTENEFMEVFISSKSDNNPYKAGDKEHWHGLYCETVIKSQKELRIPNALKDTDWDKNPDIKLGMIAYLGLPLNFPDQTPFGTICVLDSKENKFTNEQEQLLHHFKNIIELDLAFIQSLKIKKTDNLVHELLQRNSELELVNKQIKDNEKKHRVLLKKLGEGVGNVDENETFIYANREAEKIFGVDKGELVGKSLKQFLSHKNYQTVKKETEKRKNGKKSNYELKIKNKKGKEIDILITATPAYDIDGKFLSTFAVFRDITQQKQTEKELIREKERATIQNKKIQHLYQAAKAVLNFDDFTTTAKKLFNSCKQLTGASSGYVALLNEKGEENEVLFLDSGGLPCDVDESLPMPIRGLRAEAYHLSKAVFHNDFMNSEHIKFMPEGHVVLKNVMFAPLLINEKAVGLIGLANKPTNFNGEDLETVTAFAELASVALKNSRNYEELKLAKEKAIESEEKFSTIFNMSQSFICLADINTATFKFINPTFIKILGYKKEELLNKSFLEFIHPDDVKPTINVINEQLKAGISVTSFENRYRKKNGDYCWLNWNSYPVITKGITYAIAHDITERKKIQIQLKTKNEAYEAANEELRQTNDELFLAKEQAELKEKEINLTLEATTDGIWKWNFTANELFFSPNYYRMLGYEPNEFEANYDNWISLIHPDDRKKAIQTAEKWLEKKETDYENTFRLKTKNNEYLWLISTGKIVERDENGNAIRMIGNHINITPVKKAEEKLWKHKKEFQTWIQNSPICTKKIDLDFNLQFMSKSGIEELKVNDVYKYYNTPYPFHFFPESFREKMLEKMNEVKSTGKTMQIDGILADTLGKKMWYNHIIVPVKNDAGKLDYILIISSDISDRKNAEIELIKAKEKAEESDKLKSAFLQNLSHEIRTPLNAICGFSQMLNKPVLSDEKRNSFTSIIQTSSKQLLSIVTDILTISSLETKQEKIKMEKVCMNSIIVNLLATYKPQSINQNISLYAKKALNDKESEIYTDKSKLSQILNNLLSNAFKFTHEGFIEFAYKLKNNNIIFYVKDSGIGIKPELHEKIFERFRQADLSVSRQYGGTGLGLSISKGFAELLNGKIWLESEIGKGSTFYLSIPYKPVDTNNKNKKIVYKSKKPEILIAEDEEFNFLYIEELLMNLNYKLIHAKNGQEAVEIVKVNPNISLILMDIKMPIMDGHTAAKIIKKQNKNIPIIAQSAYAMEHEINKYIDIFDDYLTKPLDQNLLIEKVKQYCIKSVLNNSSS